MVICFLLGKGTFIHNLGQWWKEQSNYAVFFYFQKCGCSTTKENTHKKSSKIPAIQQQFKILLWSLWIIYVIERNEKKIF